MTVIQWASIVFLLFVAALMSGLVVTLFRRRRFKAPPQDGWLSDDMVRQIIERGTLTDGQVPEEALDLEEIAKEEERFWSETWDESEPYWE